MSDVRTTHRSNARRARGISLVELMVALAIGAFLMLGLVQVFAASKAAYTTSEGLSRVQESARFATDFLQRDLRMVGHMGCVADTARYLAGDAEMTNHVFAAGIDEASATDVPVSSDKFPYKFKIQLEGYEATGTGDGTALDRSSATGDAVASGAGDFSPAVPSWLWTALSTGDIKPVAGSDIVVARFMGSEGVAATRVGSAIEVAAGQTLPSANFVREDALYGMSDCLRASFFQANSAYDTTTRRFSVAASGLNARALGSGDNYLEGAKLFRVESYVYFVGRNEARTPNSVALYRLEFDASGTGVVSTRKEELVEGVENMQLRYQWDLDQLNANALPDGDPEAIATADTIQAWTAPPRTRADAWRRVGGVRVGLLVRSEDRASVNTAPLTVNGVTYTPPADGRVRQAYEFTVALRNRLFGN